MLKVLWWAGVKMKKEKDGSYIIKVRYKPIWCFKSIKDYLIFQSKNPLLLIFITIFSWAIIIYLSVN